MTDPAIYRRAKEIFFDLTDVPSSEWERLLDARCGEDAVLREVVWSLLDRDRCDGTPLDRPVLGDAVPQLDPGQLVDEFASAMPERIGEFRVVSVIGEGGMGVVYRAEQPQPRRDVAIKVLRSAFPTAEAVRRFELECEILGRLQHPGIASIHAAGTHRTRAVAHPYLVMELVEGDPLMDFCERALATTTDRLDLFLELCDAVHYAHGQGVVHRDLKPSNVLVDRSGRPRIIDFGVARSLASEVGAGPTTHTGGVLGTPQFMSPEQIRGQRADERSDVYALGLLLWQMVIGEPPYRLENLAADAAIRKVCHELPDARPWRQGRFPREVEAIAMRCLAKEPRDRYASAQDVALDVRRYLRGEPILARRSSWSGMTSWVRRRPKQAMLVGGLIGAAVVLGGVAFESVRANLDRARSVGHAWESGDLIGARRQWLELPSWCDRFASPGLAAHLPAVRTLRGAGPVVEVLRAFGDDDDRSALTLAARYLERDGLPAHPELARMLTRSMTPGSRDFDVALALAARLFFERPDATPTEAEASEPIRRLVVESWGAFTSEQRLRALVVLQGCASVSTLEHLSALGRDADLSREMRRMVVLCLESLFQRVPRCGFGDRLEGLNTGPLLRLAEALSADQPEWVARVFEAEAAMRSRLGQRPTRVWPRARSVVGDARLMALRRDPNLVRQLVHGDASIEEWAEMPVRSRVSLRAFEIEVLGLRHVCPGLEWSLRSESEDLVDPVSIDRYFALAADIARGLRGVYAPDADTHLGALLDGGLETPRVPEHVLAPPGRQMPVSLEWHGSQLVARGDAATVLWRNVVPVPSELDRSQSFARLGTGGISSIELGFEMAEELPDAPWAVHLEMGKALRLYLPHQGAAVVRVILDDHVLGRLLVDSRRMSELRVPIRGDRLSPGRHVVRVELDVASTTTVRIGRISVRQS